MKVRCERCQTEFSASPKEYPCTEFRTKLFRKDGDLVITCPVCRRNYFKVDEKALSDFIDDGWIGKYPKDGDFISDRILTILSE